MTEFQKALQHIARLNAELASLQKEYDQYKAFVKNEICKKADSELAAKEAALRDVQREAIESVCETVDYCIQNGKHSKSSIKKAIRERFPKVTLGRHVPAQREAEPQSKEKSMSETPIPRRIDVLRYTEAENAIRRAVQIVEGMRCDTRLTDAVVFLGQAKDRVADFVDGVEPQPKVTPGRHVPAPREAECQDCLNAAKSAYSDATTPGLFYDKCEKHRKPQTIVQMERDER
jgi:hypothetical protein